MSDNLILEHLRAIRTELGEIKSVQAEHTTALRNANAKLDDHSIRLDILETVTKAAIKSSACAGPSWTITPPSSGTALSSAS